MRSNHLTEFLTEAKDLSAGKLLNYVPYSTQTQTCEHTQREAAAAQPAKVGAGDRVLPCRQRSFPPPAGGSPYACSATLCDAHILQDKTSSDMCSISPYHAVFLPWKKKKLTVLFQGLPPPSHLCTWRAVTWLPRCPYLRSISSSVQGLAHIKTQRKGRLIKMWACSLWAQMTLGPEHSQVAIRWSMGDHDSDSRSPGKSWVGNHPWHYPTCPIHHRASIEASSHTVASLCLHLFWVTAAGIWNKTFQMTSLTPLTQHRGI